jgi:hypothetical protein
MPEHASFLGRCVGRSLAAGIVFFEDVACSARHAALDSPAMAGFMMIFTMVPS